jgi:LETM1 and EF-hand domain-containing protein 1
MQRSIRPFSLKTVNWQKFTPGNVYHSVKEFCLHFWHGCKQFGHDVRVAWGYMKIVIGGEELTRQQRRHLNQTVADMFRLVPFSVFVIVPFLELLLPFALAVFPNMLPSSFQTKSEKAAKQLRETRARIEYAKFLQDTLAEMAVDLKKRAKTGEISATAAELTTFLQKLKSGEISGISSFEITKFRQVFAEELPLWKLNRAQLQELCRFMSVNAFGPDALLRINLRLAMNKIKKDDQELFSIGVENLPYEELKHSCRARGIRTDFGEHEIARGLREAHLRKQLEAWLNLSLKENLSYSLLLMLQVFSITQVAEVGKEVHKAVAADIREQIDRARDLELIHEELQDEKKEKEQNRLIGLAKAMKAEGALDASENRVQEVREEMSEVKQDIEDTIRRLRDLGDLSVQGAVDERTKASAALLEKRLATMTTALDHALSLLPQKLAQHEEAAKLKEKKKRGQEQEQKKLQADGAVALLADALAKETVATAVVSSALNTVQEARKKAAAAAPSDAPHEVHDSIDDTIDDTIPDQDSNPAPSPAALAPAAPAPAAPATAAPETAAPEHVSPAEEQAAAVEAVAAAAKAAATATPEPPLSATQRGAP